MAKPAFIQQLDRGRILNGDNFPQFVDTWNYSVNRLENLKGDRDVNPQQGHINLDNSDPDHPVIRFVPDFDKEEEGGLSSSFDVIGQTDDSESLNGETVIQGADGCGIVFRSTRDDEDDDDVHDGTIELDLDGREDDEEFGIREVSMGKNEGQEVIAKVFGDTDFEITQKSIVAGTGI